MNDLVGDFNEFFAPVATDMISGMVARYDSEVAKVKKFHADYMEHSLAGVIGHFCSRHEDKMPSFDLDIAICSLNAQYWSQALALTDVYEAMPQKRRTEWREQLDAWKEPRYVKGKKPEHDLPDFSEAIVRATLCDLLDSRGRFFAERVDGIFRNLSKAHVTNCPQAFGKRFIIGYVLSYGSPNWEKSGYISDLRLVIAKFMGREAPDNRLDTDTVIKAAMRRTGEWLSVDGGAFRIRVYNGVGTAHLEVHPDMAWRLNAILASIYPAAIPESLRRKPVKAKKIKDFVLFDRPLPFAVVNLISSMGKARVLNPKRHEYRQNTFNYIPNSLELPSGDLDKHVVREVERVINAIGGVKIAKPQGWSYFQFDYDPSNVIEEIVCSGCIPDQKSHQYYPTPENLAKKLIEIAELEDHHQCLEPSAGTGGIADFVPEQIYLDCYEISELHCKVLESKGYARTGTQSARCADFLKVAADYRGGGYDRVLMNPPFSENRWRLHTEAAGKVLKKGGSIIAILPASAKAQLDMPGFNMKWYGPYENEFAGTSISVVILRADKC